MFTGIVRHAGKVTNFKPSAAGARLTIGASKLAAGVKHGDSIAVNGVCLTVAGSDGPLIEFDVVTETLRKSTLGALRKGAHVNLETSLRVGDSLDGHFVQGHVDGTAEFTRREIGTGDHLYWFAPQEHLLDCIVPKGSITIDGVSLTVAQVEDNQFSVALIPTTLELTTLASLRTGDHVNIETDVLARTIVHLLSRQMPDAALTLETLKSHGFA